MLNKLRNFTKSKFAGILVALIALPLLFFRMGDTFDSKSNILAKIDNKNITTNDFMDHIKQSGLSQDIIRKNINSNILSEILNELIAKELIEKEIDFFKLSISDKHLVKIIKDNKNFISNGKFDRLKYEKFLLENYISANKFEKKLRERELEKKLFEIFKGGISSNAIKAQQININNNSKVKVKYINLEKFYKKESEFSKDEIDKFINDNPNLFKNEFIDFKYAKIKPENITGSKEFSDLFFEKIDEIENNISDADNLSELLKNFESIEIIKKKGISKNTKNNDFLKIYDNRLDKGIQIIENENYLLIFKIDAIVEKTPDKNDFDFINQVKKNLYNSEKFKFNEKIFNKINQKTFNDNDLSEISKNKNDFKTITLNSIEDNKLFEINSVEYIYSSPQDSFLLVTNESKDVFLLKILEIEKKIFNENNIETSSILEKAKDKEIRDIYTSYDIYLNKKYKVEINENSMNRIRNFFK